MVWLMHMVGDVHQPLHTTGRFSKDLPDGDSGGNFVLLNSPGCTDNPATELHALWDNAIGTSSDPQAVITVASALPQQTVATTDLDVYVWLSESVRLAQTTAYIAPIGDSKGPFTVDQAYCEQLRCRSRPARRSSGHAAGQRTEH